MNIVRGYVRVYVCACMCIYVRACIHIFVRMHIHCICIYVYKYIYSTVERVYFVRPKFFFSFCNEQERKLDARSL